MKKGMVLTDEPLRVSAAYTGPAHNPVLAHKLGKSMERKGQTLYFVQGKVPTSVSPTRKVSGSGKHNPASTLQPNSSNDVGGVGVDPSKRGE